MCIEIKGHLLDISSKQLANLKDKVLVIKLGGSMMTSDKNIKNFMKDVKYLYDQQIKIVLVHGGGRHISDRLEKMGIKTNFEEGYRVTAKEIIDEVEMILSSLNKELTLLCNNLGIKTIGLNGKDGGMIQAKKMILNTDPDIDLGNVGEILKVESVLLKLLLDQSYMPIVAPIGYDKDGHTYNINADVVAGQLASSLDAEKLILMTDVNGLYGVYGNESTLIKSLSLFQARKMMTLKQLEGGMIPKIASCVEALEASLKETHIVNGNIKHAVIKALIKEEHIGTVIRKESTCTNNIS